MVSFIHNCQDKGKHPSGIILNNENRIKQLIYVKHEKYIQQANKIDFAELTLLTRSCLIK